MKNILALPLLLLSLLNQAQLKKQFPVKTIIVFFDGLRPDYITPELMPNLAAFKQQWAYGSKHHSVFPTVTRVNASSYSTGSYPSSHGLMGNTVYFPGVDSAHGLNTGNAEDMFRIIDWSHGQLLTAVTLGEVLAKNGQQMMVYSSGSTGQALMQNHTLSSGATVNPELIRPLGFKDELIKQVGDIPKKGKPNSLQHAWITDAFIHYSVNEEGPLVSAIWYSDPDGAAHSDGIGSPAAVESIKSVDQQFGRILKAIHEKGMENRFNFLISTDHGFSTHTGKEGLTELLIRKGFKKDKESTDVVVAEGALYVKNHNREKIEKIVQALQLETWVGALFTDASKKDAAKGWVPGTLAFDMVNWNHPGRKADILVDVNWNNDKNEKGYAGMTQSRGVAGHGSLSPWDVHIPLIVAGPDFKKMYESGLPSSNIDIVPTILSLYHLPVPSTMQGRPLTELFRKAKSSGKPVIKTVSSTCTYEGKTYTVTVQHTWLGKYRYVDHAVTERR